jgi:hypothetical protein
MGPWLDSIASFVWGPMLLIPLLLATGLYLTVALRGLQFHRLGYALWLALIRRQEGGAEAQGPQLSAARSRTGGHPAGQLSRCARLGVAMERRMDRKPLTGSARGSTRSRSSRRAGSRRGCI